MQQEIIEYMAIGIVHMENIDIDAAKYQAEVMLKEFKSL